MSFLVFDRKIDNDFELIMGDGRIGDPAIELVMVDLPLEHRDDDDFQAHHFASS